MSLKFAVVILAAGKGTRMKSPLPKVLQTILDKPLLGYVFDALKDVPNDNVWTVVGFNRDAVLKLFPKTERNFVIQEEQLGTGHALQIAWEHLKLLDVDYVCVVNGDTPLIQYAMIESLVAECAACHAAMGFVSTYLDNPTGYGRVVRDDAGNFHEIIEEKDLTVRGVNPAIREINAGVYAFTKQSCQDYLSLLDQNNAQKEFYITQMLALASSSGAPVIAQVHEDPAALMGVNSPLDLVNTEEMLRENIVDDFLHAGVLLRNRDQIVIGPDVRIEPGVQITGPVEIFGTSSLEHGAVIASHCVIRDSRLSGCTVHSFSHLERAVVETGASVGPYARLRPGSIIESDARVGNFVETKKTVLKKGAKAGHLSYLGDSEIGENVNIGAGTITCNYDGTDKHKTIIRQDAFIGSNTALVAPVEVGRNALVGAGSVVTKNVGEGELCIGRARQVNLRRNKNKHTA